MLKRSLKIHAKVKKRSQLSFTNEKTAVANTYFKLTEIINKSLFEKKI